MNYVHACTYVSLLCTSLYSPSTSMATINITLIPNVHDGGISATNSHSSRKVSLKYVCFFFKVSQTVEDAESAVDIN